MNNLTRSILKNKLPAVFTAKDIKRLEPNDNVRHLLMKRAVQAGDIIRVQRGIYVLGELFRKEPVDEFFLANRLDAASYISLEAALWLEGWIPSYCDEITSVTSGSSRLVKTAVGRFSCIRIPQKRPLAGVREVFYGPLAHRQAKPLKALADYVYDRRVQWVSLDPLAAVLQIEPEFLETLTGPDFDELYDNYVSAPHVEAFLDGIRKELHL